MNSRVFIIAEAGVNHNGSMDLARKLVDAAAEAGADAVKFQTFRTESLVRRNAPKAEYQKATTAAGESQFEMIRKLELDADAHRELMAHCRLRGILFLSSPFDLESIELLDALELSIFKIPSGEITNLPYLRRIGRLGKPIILSTGMADLGEVGAALEVLIAAGAKKEKITLLHCNTEYPTPMEDVNLRAMTTLGTTFATQVGYSDHTLGIEIPIAAVALGATVIEKHFTLDRTLEGPDHKASLEPGELAAMVKAIRNVSTALGSGIKAPSASERRNIPIARKSIVAARAIRRGELFSEENLATKRPAQGLSPMLWDEVLGRPANKDFAPDEPIILP
ncbi:N-acetylneuraminate synthase [Geoalkalibacter sp.]|uniref:N-acetylneuraminate synthase n=1 Tax=Geoalkalibacter sp. TaxID=3041440 RepID=UPI00272EC143|nr:N-acetylneuraminate synthase [Geoalkalibacter sp.]